MTTTSTTSAKTMTWTSRGMFVSYGTTCSFIDEHMDISKDFATDGASCLSPDGSLIAVREGDGLIRVRRVVFDEWRMGDVLFTCQQLPRADILSFAWSQSGRLVAVELANGAVCTYQTATGWTSRLGQQRSVYRLEKDLSQAVPMAFGPEGTRIALSAPPNGSVLFNAPDGSLFRTLAHVGHARSLAWAPSERFLALGGQDSSLTIVLTRSGRVLHVWTGHTAPITALCWSPDGARLISGDQHGNLQFWDTSGEEPDTWHRVQGDIRPMEAGVEALAWSPDGQRAAVLDSRDVLDIIDRVE